MTPLAIVIASDVGYLVGVGMTFQLATSLKGRDMYGYPSNAFRWIASIAWPITACIAAGGLVARRIQDRQNPPPRAIASERKVRSR